MSSHCATECGKLWFTLRLNGNILMKLEIRKANVLNITSLATNDLAHPEIKLKIVFDRE